VLPSSPLLAPSVLPSSPLLAPSVLPSSPLLAPSVLPSGVSLVGVLLLLPQPFTKPVPIRQPAAKIETNHACLCIALSSK
jgi:hypothetical protein